MELSTIVMALLLSLTPTGLDIKAQEETTLKACMEDAREINNDASIPFILVCAPVLEGDDIES